MYPRHKSRALGLDRSSTRDIARFAKAESTIIAEYVQADSGRALMRREFAHARLLIVSLGRDYIGLIVSYWLGVRNARHPRCRDDDRDCRGGFGPRFDNGDVESRMAHEPS